MASDRLS